MRILAMVLLLSVYHPHKEWSPAAQSVPPSKQFIVGRAVDSEHGTPLADAVVRGTSGSAVTDEVRTNAAGYFVLRDVGPGPWTIGAVKPGYSGSANARRQVRVTVTADVP